MTRKEERAIQLARRLPEIYPDAHCELNYETPLDLLVATILSAQCTDVRVNIVTKALFARCRTARDYATISQEDLEEIVKSAGFFRAKAKNIRAMATQLLALHDGEVPRTLAELSALPGVGRKTGNVVLGNVFSINEGFVVDTHVSRLSQRFTLTTNTDPVKIEQDLMKLFPSQTWCVASHWLIWHGRRRCMARNPDCGHCELFDLCPSGPKFLEAKELKRAKA